MGSGQPIHPYTWDRAGGFSGSNFVGQVRAISTDGSTIVGGNTTGGSAYRLRGDNLVSLGSLNPNNPVSEAVDTNQDGSVVVGESSSTNLSEGEAFVWTETGGMMGLGIPTGVTTKTSAQAVTPDGRTVAGFARYGQNDWRTFLWDETNGMRTIGGGQPSGLCMSDDASIVYANANGNFSRWTQGTGMVDLNFHMSLVESCTPDGSIVVAPHCVRAEAGRVSFP